MPLMSGVWKATVNGQATELTVGNQYPDGSFEGKIFNQQIRGFWDEVGQSIRFYAGNGAAGLNAGEVIATNLYEGWMFSAPQAAAPGQDLVWTITGCVTAWPFQVNEHLAPTSRRSRFGWIAQLTQVM